MVLVRAVAKGRVMRVAKSPGRARRRSGMARGRVGGERVQRVRGRRQIKPSEIESLAREIRTWDYARAKLTWVAVVDLAEGLFAYRWTRQALEAHDAVKSAFQARQVDGPRKARRAPRDPAMAVYARQVEALRDENRSLKAQLGAYEQRLSRWAANAFAVAAMTEAMLDMPLAPNDRGQTDPKLRGGAK